MKIYAAQNGKYTLHKARKIYTAQTGKYALDKTEYVHCTERKIQVAQNGKYMQHKTKIINNKLHKTESICFTKENICHTKENTDYRKQKMEHSSGLPLEKPFQFVTLQVARTLDYKGAKNGKIGPLVRQRKGLVPTPAAQPRFGILIC